MKKTYIITVLVDRFASINSYHKIERHWEITITTESYSKKEALRYAHKTALDQAGEEYGTSLGSWRTTIYTIDILATRPQKINY